MFRIRVPCTMKPASHVCQTSFLRGFFTDMLARAQRTRISSCTSRCCQVFGRKKKQIRFSAGISLASRLPADTTRARAFPKRGGVVFLSVLQASGTPCLSKYASLHQAIGSLFEFSSLLESSKIFNPAAWFDSRYQALDFSLADLLLLLISVANVSTRIKPTKQIFSGGLYHTPGISQAIVQER